MVEKLLKGSIINSKFEAINTNSKLFVYLGLNQENCPFRDISLLLYKIFFNSFLVCSCAFIIIQLYSLLLAFDCSLLMLLKQEEHHPSFPISNSSTMHSSTSVSFLIPFIAQKKGMFIRNIPWRKTT